MCLLAEEAVNTSTALNSTCILSEERIFFFYICLKKKNTKPLLKCRLFFCLKFSSCYLYNVLLHDTYILSIYYFLVKGLLWAIHSFVCYFTFLYQHLNLSGNFHFSAGRDQTVGIIFAKVHRISMVAFFTVIFSPIISLTLSVKIQLVLAKCVF